VHLVGLDDLGDLLVQVVQPEIGLDVLQRPPDVRGEAFGMFRAFGVKRRIRRSRSRMRIGTSTVDRMFIRSLLISRTS
jgi:hypothetical protein